MSAFDEALEVVLQNEGGFTDNPADPGNWTGGTFNVGLCRGTKWGISAAAYPTLDIRNLTENDARTIYFQRYWCPMSADRLPPCLALLVFDAAVNLGVSRSIKLLQAAVGTAQDGLLGPITLGAALKVNPVTAGIEFQSGRLLFMAGLPGWKTFGGGWARRLMKVAFKASAIVEVFT